MIKNSTKVVKKLVPSFSAIFFLFYFINSNFQISKNIIYTNNFTMSSETSVTNLNVNEILNSSLIFIGGYARSGTTLMRAILDVHDSISCGPETKILPKILQFLILFRESSKEMIELKNAGFKNNSIDQAAGLFVYQILNDHIKKAPILCAKDPDILYYMDYLHEIFSNAKFIYMIRDPRAVVYSLMTRINEPLNEYRIKEYLSTWYSYQIIVKSVCTRLGAKLCKIVKYEDLVLNTSEKTKEISAFLGIEWTENFLKHEKYVGSKIVVSQTEWSTEQIKKAIYTDSLENWKGKIHFSHNLLKPLKEIMNEIGYY